MKGNPQDDSGATRTLSYLHALSGPQFRSRAGVVGPLNSSPTGPNPPPTQPLLDIMSLIGPKNVL